MTMVLFTLVMILPFVLLAGFVLYKVLVGRF